MQIPVPQYSVGSSIKTIDFLPDIFRKFLFPSPIRTNIVLDMDAETLQRLIASNQVELTGARARNFGQLENLEYLRF